jgi:hypothetical protein
MRGEMASREAADVVRKRCEGSRGLADEVKRCPCCGTAMKQTDEVSAVQILTQYQPPADRSPITVARVRSECLNCHHLESSFPLRRH